MVRDASDGASTTWLRRNAGVARLDAVLILACAVMLLPFVWMILTSLKKLPDTTQVPQSILPSQWQWSKWLIHFTARGTRS